MSFNIIFNPKNFIPGNIKKGYMCKQSGKYGKTWHSKPYKDFKKAMRACVMNNECIGVGNFACANISYDLCNSVWPTIGNCVHLKDGVSIH